MCTHHFAYLPVLTQGFPTLMELMEIFQIVISRPEKDRENNQIFSVVSRLYIL